VNAFIINILEGASVDAAERYKLEKNSLELERKFRSLADNSPDMIVRYDRSLRRTYVNLAWERATGLSAEDVLNRSAAELRGLMTLAKSSEYEDKLLSALETGESVSMEVTLQHADGAEVHLERRIVPEFDVDGKVVSLFSISRDITERKKNEDMLRIAAAAFETHEAIIITDTDANIIRVNQAFHDITGYSAEEVLGQNPRILSGGRHDKEFYEKMWQAILSKGSWTGEIWDKRKNGEIYPKWITITAVKDRQGETMQYVGIFNDISERKKAQEEILNLAFYDSLTKLPNRRFLLDRIHSAQALSSRTGLYGAVLFLDLDRFKLINDSFGHSYGDLLLIEVAERIRVCVRSVDTVARLGGDEFVVLVENMSDEVEKATQTIAHIADNIRSVLALPYVLDERIHHSSPSIGVYLFKGDEQSVDSLLKYADVAMYQAKDAGRNSVRFYDPVMQQAVEARTALETDLRQAIQEMQFILHYQVQMDNGNRPLGAEALIRWQHPLRGMVSPAEFIPVAEESSLILEIGNWVLETACHQLAEWSGQGVARGLSLSVNVSAQQFRQSDFVSVIAALLHKYDLDASRIKLELTEGVILNDVNDVAGKMHALKALGVALSLDDFGTGYSSLSYLKQLPLDQIKIDQSFVRNVTDNHKDAILVQTIIDLAQNFGFDVIAEGVETEAQLAFLKQHDCMSYQGFLFSKPLPIDEFTALLQRFI
jgi:diguanylate cyclase (GGDEF)-like protein/PAS domain S-box-containing protein